jgi:nucleoside phosphorylase
MSNTTVTRRAVILTALRLEYVAVQAHLHNFREHVDGGTVYEIGTFITPSYTWEVCIVEIGTGNEEAALAAQSALNYFKPEVAFFVGVAGGLKENELTLGDVVCSTKVYGYEFGKDTEHGFKPRPEVRNSSFRLISRARNEARKDKWQERIASPISDATPTVHVAPIAAGEKILGQASAYNFLRESFSDALAVETEGFGFLLAMDKKPEIDAMIIRGISNLILNKTPEQDKKWQPIAAHNAGAFAFEILAKLPIEGQETLPPIAPQMNVPTNTSPAPAGNAPSPASNESVQIFYSYVEQDQTFVDQLDKHLAVLRRRQWVVTSYAGKAGADRMELLNQADIILLMISSNFIDSPDIYAKEVKCAMERRKEENIVVIPVLLRPTANWKLEEFGTLQSVPRDGKPVSAHSDKDDAFKTIAEEISAIVMGIRKARGLSS